MKFLITLLLAMNLLPIWAQSPATDSVATDGDIRLSPELLRELDRAFSFGPVQTPIQVPDSTLNTELLHQWVGEPDASSDATSGYYRQKFDSTYFALKVYLKEFCRWEPPQEIKIPGLQGLSGPVKAASEGIGHTFSVDVNALAKYIRPSARRLRRSRQLAEEHRAEMDAAFPMWK